MYKGSAWVIRIVVAVILVATAAYSQETPWNAYHVLLSTASSPLSRQDASSMAISRVLEAWGGGMHSADGSSWVAYRNLPSPIGTYRVQAGLDCRMAASQIRSGYDAFRPQLPMEVRSLFQAIIDLRSLPPRLGRHAPLELHRWADDLEMRRKWLDSVGTRQTLQACREGEGMERTDSLALRALQVEYCVVEAARPHLERAWRSFLDTFSLALDLAPTNDPREAALAGLLRETFAGIGIALRPTGEARKTLRLHLRSDTTSSVLGRSINWYASGSLLTGGRTMVISERRVAQLMVGSGLSRSPLPDAQGLDGILKEVLNDNYDT